MLNDSTIWYVDSLNYRIVKINSSGVVQRTVGRQGSDEGEFNYPLTSITRDSDGYLYVLSHERVYKLDFNGGYVDSWGVLGNGGGAEFSNPKAIHFDSFDQTLLISDTGNNRIARFSTSGTFFSEFGTSGTGDGEFDAPQGITTDEAGNIYVVDVDNHRVQVFDTDGNFIRAFGGTTPGNYYLEFPKDIEVLSNGDIVVTSQNSNLIKKFNDSGVYITEWATTLPQYITKATDDSIWVAGYDQKSILRFSDTGSLTAEIKNSGTTAGRFSNPYNYDYDSSGNIYVIDDTARVQKFGSDGAYIDTIIEGASEIGGSAYHVAVAPASGNIVVSSEQAVSVFDEYGTFISNIGEGGVAWVDDGSLPGEFNHARDMAFDINGYLYVLDYFNARVQKFDLSNVAAGDFLSTYDGGYVTSWSVMADPLNIFIDSNSIVYVSPREENGGLPVLMYSDDGVPQGTLISAFGSDPDQYWTINGIFIDEDDADKIYITDSYFDRIQVYSSAGTWIETIGGAGSGRNQLDNPGLASVHPTTGSLVVSDEDNHRLQIFTEGVRIKNLTPSADIIDPDLDRSLVSRTITPTSDLTGELYFGDYIVSDFEVDLSSDRDWNSVNVVIHPEDSKSLVVNLNPTDAPGIGSSHSLYIVKASGQNTVRVCPDADVIAEVVDGCTNGYDLTEGDPSLSTIVVDTIEYWKVTGLTGTGAFAYTDDTPSSSSNSSSNNSSSSSSQSGGGSSNSSTSCDSTNVDGIVDLFQINALGSKVTLYFAPLPNTNTYFISFATSPNAEEHGAQATLAREGVQNFTISHLKPNTTYYFKVRGQNGCKSGEWSTILPARTTPLNAINPVIYYKYGNIKSVISRANVGIKKASTSPTPAPTNVSVVEITASTPAPTQQSKPVESKKKCFLWWCF